MWFHPIIDYSIPHKIIYKTISACELLKTCEITSDKQNILNNSNQKIVIIAPGVYRDMDKYENLAQSNINLPFAIAYWRNKTGWNDFFRGKNTFTTGEYHAYTIHNFINRNLVIPIPDWVMILLISILGKFIKIKLFAYPNYRQILSRYLGLLILAYIFFSVIIGLQIYITARVLIPWLLPSITLWNYIRFGLKRQIRTITID